MLHCWLQAKQLCDVGVALQGPDLQKLHLDVSSDTAESAADLVKATDQLSENLQVVSFAQLVAVGGKIAFAVESTRCVCCGWHKLCLLWMAQVVFAVGSKIKFAVGSTSCDCCG